MAENETAGWHGTVIWNELVTPDQKKGGDFFAALLGWSRKEVEGPGGPYTLFQKDGKDVAGMMNPATEYSRARPPFWSAYIAVEDIDATVARVPALGGEIIAPPVDVPGVGRVCMLADPTGAPICLMTPARELPEE